MMTTHAPTLRSSSSRTPTLASAGWWIPAGLLTLSAVPAIAGMLRLTGLARGKATLPDHARFAAEPLPVVLHILAATTFAVLGALQFSAAMRRRQPRWHRASGRVLSPAGLVVALSGMWMAVRYPPAEYDGPALTVMRLGVGAAMTGFILFGLAALRRRDFAAHGAWMTRAYALGMAAGTQVFTHVPAMVFEELRSVDGRAVMMGAGWAINAVVAEWALRQRAARRQAAAA